MENQAANYIDSKIQHVVMPAMHGVGAEGASCKAITFRRARDLESISA